MFTRNRIQIHEKKNEELLAIKTNTNEVQQIDAKIGALYDQTVALKSALTESFEKSWRLAGADYSALQTEDKMILGALVNNAKTLAQLLNAKIAQTIPEEDENTEADQIVQEE